MRKLYFIFILLTIFFIAEGFYFIESVNSKNQGNFTLNNSYDKDNWFSLIDHEESDIKKRYKKLFSYIESKFAENPDHRFPFDSYYYIFSNDFLHAIVDRLLQSDGNIRTGYRNFLKENIFYLHDEYLIKLLSDEIIGPYAAIPLLIYKGKDTTEFLESEILRIINKENLQKQNNKKREMRDLDSDEREFVSDACNALFYNNPKRNVKFLVSNSIRIPEFGHIKLVIGILTGINEDWAVNYLVNFFIREDLCIFSRYSEFLNNELKKTIKDIKLKSYSPHNLSYYEIIEYSKNNIDVNDAVISYIKKHHSGSSYDDDISLKTINIKPSEELKTLVNSLYDKKNMNGPQLLVKFDKGSARKKLPLTLSRNDDLFFKLSVLESAIDLDEPELRKPVLQIFKEKLENSTNPVSLINNEMYRSPFSQNHPYFNLSLNWLAKYSYDDVRSFINTLLENNDRNIVRLGFKLMEHPRNYEDIEKVLLYKEMGSRINYSDLSNIIDPEKHKLDEVLLWLYKHKKYEAIQKIMPYLISNKNMNIKTLCKKIVLDFEVDNTTKIAVTRYFRYSRTGEHFDIYTDLLKSTNEVFIEGVLSNFSNYISSTYGMYPDSAVKKFYPDVKDKIEFIQCIKHHMKSKNITIQRECAYLLTLCRDRDALPVLLEHTGDIKHSDRRHCYSIQILAEPEDFDMALKLIKPDINNYTNFKVLSDIDPEKTIRLLKKQYPENKDLLGKFIMCVCVVDHPESIPLLIKAHKAVDKSNIDFLDIWVIRRLIEADTVESLSYLDYMARTEPDNYDWIKNRLQEKGKKTPFEKPVVLTFDKKPSEIMELLEDIDKPITSSEKQYIMTALKNDHTGIRKTAVKCIEKLLPDRLELIKPLCYDPCLGVSHAATRILMKHNLLDDPLKDEYMYRLKQSLWPVFHKNISRFRFVNMHRSGPNHNIKFEYLTTNEQFWIVAAEIDKRTYIKLISDYLITFRETYNTIYRTRWLQKFGQSDVIDQIIERVSSHNKEYGDELLKKYKQKHY